MTMDAEHNETNPTIPFHLSHEDFDVHITHISRKTQEKARHKIEFWKCLYTVKWTLRAMKLLPRFYFLHIMNIYICIYIRIYV